MKYKKELKIGIFVVLVLLMTFFVINFLRGKDIFNREIDLYACFENVEGLQPSAPVNIRGFKAGSVTDVRYDRETDLFTVSCSVKKEFVIPKDSRIVIYSTDIMGGKGVKIEIGTSRSEVKKGDELEGAVEADLIASLTEGVAPVMGKFLETVNNLNALLNNVNSVFSDENKASITSALHSVRQTMANLKSLSASLDKKLPEIEQFISDLSVLSGKLSAVLDAAESSVSNVNDITASFKESEFADVIGSLNRLLQKFQDPEGTFGKLMEDGRVYDTVDSLMNNINDLVEKMKENPKKYMKISVF